MIAVMLRMAVGWRSIRGELLHSSGILMYGSRGRHAIAREDCCNRDLAGRVKEVKP